MEAFENPPSASPSVFRTPALPEPLLAAPPTPCPAAMEHMTDISPPLERGGRRADARSARHGATGGGGRSGASNHGGSNGTGRWSRDWTVQSSRPPLAKKTRWEEGLDLADRFASSITTPSSSSSNSSGEASSVSAPSVHWLCQIPPSRHVNPEVGV